jgi:short-subunit dehydrogenase
LSIKARRLKKNISITCIEPGFVNTKMAHGGDKMFWIVPVEKAARQILRGIGGKKKKDLYQQALVA